jgi:outer membrane protein TolC
MNWLKKTALLVLLFAVPVLVNTPGTAREKEPAKKIKIIIADEPAMVLGSMKITLGQAIEWAVKQNFDMLSVSYEVAMVDTMYQQFQKKFAPLLSLEGGGMYARYPPSMQMLYGIDEKRIDAKASIYKNFPSGTTIIGGLTHEYSDLSRDKTANLVIPGITQAMGPSKAHKPAVFLTVQQELLKNAFGINDRKMEKILKNSEKMKKEAVIFQLSLVIVKVIGEYWTVVMNKVSLENAELQVKETRKVRNITARNVRYGLADNFSLNYYNALVAGAEARVAAARQRYRNSLRSFLTTINVEDNVDVTGIAVFSNKYPEINAEEALKAAYRKRSDYRNALLNLETAEMMLKVSKNERLPSIIAELNLASRTENRSFGSSYGDTFKGKYPAIEGRLKLSYPLYDKDLKTKERNARFRVKQAKIQLDKYRRVVKDDIVAKIEEIETSYFLYRKAMEARKQSELFYKRMLGSLRRGRLNSALVKNGLDALVMSREQELQALVYYNISLLQYDVARNELFDKYQIEIEKYIPRDKGRKRK